MIALSLAILFISAAALGLELVLIRALSIGQWHHFAYLVISTALLGFGASASVISIAQKFFLKHRDICLYCLCLGLGVAGLFTFWLGQKLPFDQLRLVWDMRQLVYLFGYYLLFFVPFFFAGAFICLVFTAFAEKAHSLYFFNMTGSGLGAIGLVFLMHRHSPEQLLFVVAGLSFLSALILSYRSLVRVILAIVTAAVVFFVFSDGGLLELETRISENKSLSYYESLPDAKTLVTTYSPLARLDIIQAPTIRHLPGLSIAFEGLLPEQFLLIWDADGASAINRFNDLQDLACYDYVTSALGYHLLEKPNVCIIGSGGGSDIAQGLYLNAAKITAVEMNRQIIELLQGKFASLASDIYNLPEVHVVIADGRNFLQRSREKFDLIQISLLDSFSTGSAGHYALNESHLYTVQAFEKALDRLTEEGLFSVTRSLRTPARDTLKILATAVAALERIGVGNPADHIVVIRSWATATILISPQPISGSRIARTVEFCRQRRFDTVHFAGIAADQANLFHVLDTPVYYHAAKEILGPDSEDYFENYAFNIRPATDDKPYFFDFFKFKAMGHMIRTLPERWLPYVEWGYFIILITLAQAVVLSLIFILLPLGVAKPLKSAASGKMPVCGYFLLLGFGYMFLEMGFIQKMTLLIGDPVYGVAVTLFSFLFFSGCGSVISARLFGSMRIRIVIAVAAIIVIGIIEITMLGIAVEWLIGFSRTGRIISGIIICAPLALFMGMPFPMALRELGKSRPAIVPWAWGVNGFGSVCAAVLGTLLAISLGFTALGCIALVCYLLGGLVSIHLPGFESPDNRL